MSKKEVNKKIAEITEKITKKIKPEKIIWVSSYDWRILERSGFCGRLEGK